MKVETSQNKIEIVYQDNDFVVANKPSGLLCVPGLSEPDNLFDRVKCQYANARVVHRLDMPTSGLVIFALHHEAQKQMGKLFELRQVRKTYSAKVYGELQALCGEIESPLICDWPNRPKQKIDWLSGKPASTFFEKQEYLSEENVTRIKLYPHSGRTHQLRVHMLQIGHPILGDQFYACEAAKFLSPRLCLHAETIAFKHPLNQSPVYITNKAPF